MFRLAIRATNTEMKYALVSEFKKLAGYNCGTSGRRRLFLPEGVASLFRLGPQLF